MVPLKEEEGEAQQLQSHQRVAAEEGEWQRRVAEGQMLALLLGAEEGAIHQDEAVEAQRS